MQSEELGWQLIDRDIIKNSIVDIKELVHIKLLAIASLDKKVSVWSLMTKTHILSIDLSIGGVHHIEYSYDYQALITVGYENIINIFSINPNYFDSTKEGRLVGHTSMVTAIELISGTPLLVSTDDSGIVKLWDIRNMKCI